MSRINDLGGTEGFGPVVVEADEPPFHADWEARVFALNGALVRRGVYNLDEFRNAVETLAPADHLEISYYERWLAAATRLLEEKGVLGAADLDDG